MKQDKKRIEYLKQIGISKPLIRMGQGEMIHPFFESAYEEPNYIYQIESIPDEMTPLWELEEFQTSIFETNKGIMFVQVNLEDPDATLKVIGFTEQAALARLFIDTIEVSNLETNELIKQVKEASECTGFKYCEEFIILLKLYDEDENEFFKQFDIFQKRTDW